MPRSQISGSRLENPGLPSRWENPDEALPPIVRPTSLIARAAIVAVAKSLGGAFPEAGTRPPVMPLLACAGRASAHIGWQMESARGIAFARRLAQSQAQALPAPGRERIKLPVVLLK